MSTVIAISPPLAAEYATVPSPRRAEIDATFTIAPAPRAAITGTAYLDARNAVRRLTSKARSQASSVVSTTVPSAASPMLVTRMSTVPNASTAARTIASHEAARVRSPPNTAALPPSSSIICRVCSARSGYRSTSRTLAPSRASTTAVALPVPIPGPGVEPAPVTIATLPSTRPARSTMSRSPFPAAITASQFAHATSLPEKVSICYLQATGSVEGAGLPGDRIISGLLPLGGLSVVEVAAGVSDLGLGLAGGVPGMLLADLGASVVRVTGAAPVPIDSGVTWRRAWHRDKRVVAAGDSGEVLALLRGADVALVYGPEALVEGQGLGYRDLRPVNPSLVYARCRPSRTSAGSAGDFGLLVEARAGLCTQLAGHRPGPVFADVRAPGFGAACLLVTSVLALLCRRARTGAGGWAETSLYDGMLATLGCMIGRSERAAPEIEGYWEKGSTFPNFLYRCADGELLQVWFGGKGMYAKLISVLGDEPSEEGYYSDQMTGKLGERAARWVSFFATRPRDGWIPLLRAAGIACEPVLGPGGALADPHLAEIGLAVRR